MPTPHVKLACAATATLEEALDAAVDRAGLSLSYPADALAAAEAAVAAYAPPTADRTDVPFVTIDPEGSTDLDQALWIEPEGEGFRVLYAIADVPAFVELGTALDEQTRTRGATAYLPHRRLPLHPDVIGEQAGSLLGGQERGAYVFDMAVAADGSAALRGLERARVRSREQLSYTEAQRRLEASDPLMVALAEVGRLRREDERRRDGANLNLPEVEVEETKEGGYELVTRVPLPIEEDNAQISLMTGILAADVMLKHGVGVVRTMPAADESTIERFRAVTRQLGRPWGKDEGYGEFLDGLDVAKPKELAIMHAAGALFRGASYTAFDGATPPDPVQAAVGAPYAHTTAPLRRLIDRFVLVTVDALANGDEVPAGIREALPLLPELMRSSGSAIAGAERDCTDLVEAFVLSGSIGEEFDAVVLEGAPQARRGDDAEQRKPQTVRVQLVEPPVAARAEGAAAAGDAVVVRVVAASVEEGTVRLEIVAAAAGTAAAG